MTPRSLVWATSIDVLPADKQVFRRDGYLVVRSASNPDHYWGNLLIWDGPPAVGDRDTWIAAFRAELPEVSHCTLAWEGVQGDLGAIAEFPDFHLERTAGLVARPGELAAHPRANTEIVVHRLDPSGDDALWRAVIALWESQNADDDHPTPPDYGSFARARIAELRTIFRAGRGGWFVAIDGDAVVGSLGVVVTDGRARFQAVDTRLSHRGRGVASRLVIDAAVMSLSGHDISSFVIAADPVYHALGIYESLGFRRVEDVAGVCRWPASPAG